MQTATSFPMTSDVEAYKRLHNIVEETERLARECASPRTALAIRTSAALHRELASSIIRRVNLNE